METSDLLAPGLV